MWGGEGKWGNSTFSFEEACAWGFGGGKVELPMGCWARWGAGSRDSGVVGVCFCVADEKFAEGGAWEVEY
ncbi:hypothetical protein CFELI_02390 [Corynebacterium felinum]|uniref:Uncharacterized protein n=1 Tax=Corynebacterium felinum TaxID=131318 RepID=A0ABU2B832_9CORY|nr:hypothetical protein [Corynebacterium felinum]WJY94120.1 hypothetical protein CFELI_02390 [Corynebacterium felinum]